MDSVFEKQRYKDRFVIMNKFGEYFCGLLYGEPLWTTKFDESKKFIEDTKHIILSRKYPELNIESVEI